SGDTPLTIDENGIYLYQGNVVIKNFLNNISRCAVDFDIKINSNGTSRYPQWRRALTIDNLNLGVHYSGNYTTNKFFFEMLGNISFESISPTKSTYADEKFHHITVYFDVKNQFILAYTDNQDPIAMKYNANDGSNIYIGDDNYGLNGYIKNLVIKEI
ncbi:MAG: hypothetical protein K2G04_00010, partial [Oscillospiraceae bacterium]|nr:hypothetical protein [Oscillospiraceae bacterium]